VIESRFESYVARFWWLCKGVEGGRIGDDDGYDGDVHSDHHRGDDGGGGDVDVVDCAPP